MSENIDAHAYANKILSITERRAQGETIAVPIDRLRAVCHALINGVAPVAKVLPPVPSGPLPTQRDSTLYALEQAGGTLYLNDLQTMLGHKKPAITKGVITKLINEKKVEFDEKSLEVRLVA